MLYACIFYIYMLKNSRNSYFPNEIYQIFHKKYSYKFLFWHLVPRRSPENVNAEVETSTSIYVDWANVTSNFVHGILLGYNVAIQRTKDESTRYVDAPPGEKDRPIYVTNLKKYTEYTIWVRARNSKGIGQLNSPDGFRLRTKEDGMFICGHSFL